MRDQATKLYQLITSSDQLRKARIGLYGAFKELHNYQFKEEDHLEFIKKLNLVEEKITSVDFTQHELDLTDESDQHAITAFLRLHLDFNYEGNVVFSQTSQFDAKNPNPYRGKMAAGEVKLIPPFCHLRSQFRPPDSCLASRFQDDDEDEIEYEPTPNRPADNQKTTDPKESIPDYNLQSLKQIAIDNQRLSR
ncbi:hypothetical protein RFI_21580 [Reticulomyxa filosa]|uniref:Uncharacterized protein n=1 Tax=Reticulomyxa filosa TaxID=46433 RepID=X6MP55_RETFI|nr:hypothetical protein RFI_21580 [Reticulomyxa filosa]|eukprot:ETO15783.1 hypothetical protein RFI_21580 [Reticulomyxa filosa]